MNALRQKIVAAAPVVPVILTILLWITSYSHVFQVAIHGPGSGYMYVDSGPGRLCLGRCFDIEARWRGIRHSVTPLRGQANAWIWSMGQPFDMAYAENAGYEEIRVWFPHWALCVVCALWPAHCLYIELRRRFVPVPRTAWACC